MYYKLIVNNTRGYQQIFRIKKSGKYFDNDRVVWDERVHGPIPNGTELGGLRRVIVDGRPTLQVNQAEKDAHDQAIRAIETLKNQEDQRFNQAIAFLKDIDGNVTTIASARQAFKAYNVILRRLINELND